MATRVFYGGNSMNDKTCRECKCCLVSVDKSATFCAEIGEYIENTNFARLCSKFNKKD